MISNARALSDMEKSRNALREIVSTRNDEIAALQDQVADLESAIASAVEKLAPVQRELRTYPADWAQILGNTVYKVRSALDGAVCASDSDFGDLGECGTYSCDEPARHIDDDGVSRCTDCQNGIAETYPLESGE